MLVSTVNEYSQYHMVAQERKIAKTGFSETWSDFYCYTEMSYERHLVGKSQEFTNNPSIFHFDVVQVTKKTCSALL